MTTESVSQFVADPLPFARLLGLELVSVTPDRVEALLQVREDLCTRPTVLYGGAAMGESQRWSSRSRWCCQRRGSPQEGRRLWTCMSILE